MARYKVLQAQNGTLGGWLDTITQESIPNDQMNTDCQRVLKWIAQGNTPDIADPFPDPVVPSTTPRFQKVKDRINNSALPAAQKTALIDILGTLVDNS